MKTSVKFETAKLLKERGFDEKCSHYYIDNFHNFKHDNKLYKTSLPDLDNENILQFVKRTKQPHLCNAPTIAEVVMWLYEKQGIWIWVSQEFSDSSEFRSKFSYNFRSKESFVPTIGVFNTPTEVYEAAINAAINYI